MRKIININNSWKFIREDEVKAMNKAYNDENWEVINVPHTWNAFDGVNGLWFNRNLCDSRRNKQRESLINN